MNKRTEKVLKLFVETAKRGERSINVFDLMYETCLNYPALKAVLNELISANELKEIDIKTYEYTGETNRSFESLEPPARDYLSEPFSSRAEDGLYNRREYLEARRRELIERMKREAEEAADEESEPEDNEEDGLFDIDALLKNDELSESENSLEDENGEESAEDESGASTCEAETADAEKINRLEFIVSVIGGKHGKSGTPAPEHSSWYDEDLFLHVCADKIKAAISADIKAGRKGAVAKANEWLGVSLKSGDMKFVEVYERVIFELENMSNYYFVKIRGFLS